MEHDLVIALQITAIGMGLVFGAIILLWGVMSALVRLTAARPVQADEVEAAPTELELKQQAAAVAVSLALAQASSDTEPHEFPLPATALVSAWQAVMRTKMLNKRGPVR